MRDASHGYDVSIGMKRKRVVSGSENTSGRSAHTNSRAKRRRPMPDSSEEEEASGMEVDEQESVDSSDQSDDDDEQDSCA